ncbi:MULTISPECIES: PfkB family carbohydrate kinase [unclassified Oceanispirochaeta]|uniref:PfkB family carbohydrate kinase n=1 Tax=unclassified Oceanispirochaeta TaxID=2635722 RepID=UPI000E098274|nr:MULTISPECIES: PfkB family carbohydrate kinase [unclassified Oceanispirochaeta]MBF9014313.1 carbohydrate kinase [Oceanispirochaeta sp. M2]NPD71199.1 carbohydrate kinase [Oceanispirochaeta sp. M1]RDG33587.1 carbohydrate kinase [Oceanispirochaeta sp. M1]
MKTLSFGEILFDRIDGDDYFGGAPANIAVHLSRFGAESYMLSALGQDVLGNEASEILASEKIKSDYIYSSPHHPTGIIEVQVTNGIPSYDIREGSAWDCITPDDGSLRKMMAEKWDLLYCGTLAQRTESNRRLLNTVLENGDYKELFFDVNIRQNYYSKEILENTLKFTSILKLNDEELPLVSKLVFGAEMTAEDFFAKASGEYPMKLLVITYGHEGAELYHKETKGKALKITGSKVFVIDTIGAGESFSGTFLYYYLRGDSLEKAGKKAALVADFVVGHSGATPELDEKILSALAE